MPRSRRASEQGLLSDKLADRIRRAIVHGELRPNQRLVESDLAEKLQVSRTPVREALSKLVAERQVTSARRGWLVREHTSREIDEIFEIRTALEGYAAYLAAARRTESELEAILATQANEAQVLASGHDRHFEANDEIHDLIVRSAHNASLADAIQSNRVFYFNYQLAPMYTKKELRTSQGQHRAIVDAVARGDSQQAEDFAREHIDTARRVALAKLMSPKADPDGISLIT